MHDLLIASWDGGGNVAPLCGAIRRLRARGHRVRVLGDDATRTELEAAGGIFRPWQVAPNRRDRHPDSDPMRDWEATEPGSGLLRLLDKLMVGPAAAYGADTLAELRREPAEVVITSEMLFGPMMAAEAAGAPLVLLGMNISPFPIEGMPPMGPGLTPPQTAEEHAVAAEVAGWMAGQLAARLPALNAARAALGLKPLARPLEQLRAAQLTLLATSAAFDFPIPSLPTGLRYVGPLLDEPDWARGWNSPWPAGDRRPLVLVALSTTFQDQAGVIQRVVDAAESLPLRVVATLGPALAGTALRVPANASVVEGASHEAILREAALVVTHGGHGIVMRALAHGRPMLCLPMGRDQNDNAARVAARGAGLRLPPESDVAQLRSALVRLASEDSFAGASRTLGQAIACAEKPDALVDALERIAAQEACRPAA